jgi:cardiolipin synthase
MLTRKETISSVYTAINQVKLIRAGKEYFNLLLQLIHEAKEDIYIQSYIFDDDETGRLIADRKMAPFIMAGPLM